MKIINGSRHLAWIGLILLIASAPAFAKNSGRIHLRFAMTVNATEIPAGDYEVYCEVHGPVAMVTFRRDNHIVVTFQGTLVQYDRKFRNESIVYETNAGTSHTLLEIRLKGMSEGIVLRESGSLPFDSKLGSKAITAEVREP